MRRASFDDRYGATSNSFTSPAISLERQHQLDGVERVRAQVIDERRLVLDLGLVDSELLGDDLLDALFDVFHPRLLPVGAMLCVGQEGLVFYDITMPPLTCSTAPVT